MTLIRSSIPTPISGLNVLGRGLAVAGMPAIHPEADRLVRSAEAKTGPAGLRWQRILVRPAGAGRFDRARRQLAFRRPLQRPPDRPRLSDQPAPLQCFRLASIGDLAKRARPAPERISLPRSGTTSSPIPCSRLRTLSGPLLETRPPLQAAGQARQSTADHDPRLQHAEISRPRRSQAIRREAAASCDGVFVVALVRHDRG